jgi:hypothetical protein
MIIDGDDGDGDDDDGDGDDGDGRNDIVIGRIGIFAVKMTPNSFHNAANRNSLF